MKPLILAADGQQDHEGLLRELFPPAKYEPCIIVPSASAARQLLPTRRFSMVVIFTPLADEYGIRSAMEIAASFDIDVLLFVPADKFDQAAYTVRETSVFVLSLPVNRQAAWQAVAVVEKARLKIRQVERQLARTLWRMNTGSGPPWKSLLPLILMCCCSCRQTSLIRRLILSGRLPCLS